MNRSELQKFDGRDGRKAYVAVNGTIYDFTGSDLWRDGNHQGDHQAGSDLTEELKSAPHVRAVIERFPVVGKLEEESTPTQRAGSRTLVLAMIAAAIVVAVVLAAVL